MTPQQYDELVAAIVEAVPDIEAERKYREKIFGRGNNRHFVHRGVTLEDVLIALKKSKREWIYAVDCYGNLLEYNPEEGWEVEVYEHKLFRWELGETLEWHRDNSPEICFMSLLIY